MTHANATRRTFMATAGLAAVGSAMPATAAPSSDFSFEITRTDEEWRAMLSEREYDILRNCGTEFPATGTMWKDYTPGEFHCRGCDLHLYTSDFREKIDKGWVFFSHGIVDNVMLGIDKGNRYTMAEDDGSTLIETHCRRCGSHLGHIVYISKKIVHCINSTALVRKPKAA